MKMKMKRYSPEFKESVMRKMMPPENVPIMKLSEEGGVSYVTLAKWRDEARGGGEAAPGNGERPDRWSSEDKFLIVLETHSLNEAELGEYCRSKGIFPAEIEEWRETCLMANQRDLRNRQEMQKEIRAEKKRSKELERELLRKERALAETAALLTLRKKAQAIWGDDEGAPVIRCAATDRERD